MQKWKATFQMGFHHLMEAILNTGKIEWKLTWGKCLDLSCFRIQFFEETKDCISEGSKKEQQTGNRYHPGWIDRFSEIQGGIMCISKRSLGQATTTLCRVRNKKRRRS
jgi:hypothetical protein